MGTVRLRLLAGATGLLLAAGLGLGGTAAPARAAAPAPDRTSAVEARRVDAVPTPKPAWYACYGTAQCATVRLPLDYDEPRGATVEVGLLRLRAKDQKHRIGSLFVNPGGPGGSAASFVLSAAADVLDPALLARFDVVGVDPRGIGVSQQVRCFRTPGEQARVAAAFEGDEIPRTAAQVRAVLASAAALGRACSTTGEPLSAAMSTAEVARDMDVLRRAVGDRQLSYLGFSYGTYLGEVYANLFPDRVRTLVLDGVVDPLAWAGTATNAAVPVTDRLRSGDASWAALREILVRCDRAGGKLCPFAPGDPVANFALITRRLRAAPLVLEVNGDEVRLTEDDLVEQLQGMLYDPSGSAGIADLLSQLIVLTEPPAASAAGRVTASRSGRAAARRALSRWLAAHRAQRHAGARLGFPYDNSLEAYAGVMCSDSLNPADPAQWPASADAADLRAPYFGRLWTWGSAPCARSTWRAVDEDAYRGPFTRRTAHPVLVVGNLWDPATRYQSAQTVAGLMPGSRLLSSDSWGHTAYGTSDCVSGAVDAYLVRAVLPRPGTLCHGDQQPFRGSGSAANGPRRAGPAGRPGAAEVSR